MKRVIVAVSLAALAVPAFAAQPTFEQTELDRTLPNVQEQARAERVSIRQTPDYNFIAPAQ